MSGPAILVGYFSIEANSFVDAETTLDDFRWQTFAVAARCTATRWGRPAS